VIALTYVFQNNTPFSSPTMIEYSILIRSEMISEGCHRSEPWCWRMRENKWAAGLGHWGYAEEKEALSRVSSITSGMICEIIKQRGARGRGYCHSRN